VKQAVLAVLLGLVLSPAGADSPFAVVVAAQTAQTAKGVQNAFSRVMSKLDALTLRQPATSTSLFPEGGFAPRASDQVHWQVQKLDSDRVAVCIATTVQDVAEWSAVVVAATAAGLSAAGEDCAVHRMGTPPSGYPALVLTRKEFNRLDVPTATKLPATPWIQGPDALAVTRPGLILNKPGSHTDVSVTNISAECRGTLEPCLPLLPPLSLVAYKVRSGFSVEHNCVEVPAGSTCTVRVYLDAAQPAYLSPLRLEFSNQAIASIGLLGNPPKTVAR
jgi:hypothetical protein